MKDRIYKPLTVLNASAGSGKTFQLVKAYIKLLIKDENHFKSFSNVIAMTFTNKAAVEMKERIILALDEIGSGLENNLRTELCNEFNISAETLNYRCKNVLESILHSYEDFHVMTIDKFNLRLIKSFGRDLDLPSDFEVVMDETEIIEKIVDDILNQLGETGSDELNKLILSYARNNIDEGNQWNFRRSLVDFAKILKNEKNHKIVEKLLGMDFSVAQFARLKAERNKIDQLFSTRCKELNELVLELNLIEDKLPGKSRTMGAITKLTENTDFPLKDIASTTFRKVLTDEPKPEHIFPNEIRSQLRSVIEYWDATYKDYSSLELYMRNFFNMALLQYLAIALKKVRKEEQLIRISEFNELIAELIQNENTPFIYERLGNKFHHFLLDEFQDTSRLQWINLVPLVHESLSHEYENLIVGDPKQSIYRFKNGIAEQFVELPHIYNPEKNKRIAEQSLFFSQMGVVKELDNNFRSSPIIVNLNNAFFKEMKAHIPTEAAKFYNSINQIPQSSLKGKVHIVSKEEKVNAQGLLPLILKWVKECELDGFRLGEICILGSTNKECNQWAIGLNEQGYKVVSTDSLLINSNLKVQLTIAYLKRRLNPSGENEKKRFAELYFRIKSDSYSEYKSYILEKESAQGKKYRMFNDELFLTDHFSGSEAFFFKHEDIYDLVENFYKLMGYDELSDSYLHHLADIAFDYGLKRGPDLKGFLNDYEAKKGKIAVQVPESDDALQLMTIHKSKGLEFPVVIIPSMNFPSEVKSHFLVDIDDYVVYKKPSGSEKIDVLQEIHQSEITQIVADNVNKCYVSMTRPMERLYVGNFFEKKTFGQLFHKVISSMDDVHAIDDRMELDLGEGIRSVSKKESAKINNYSPKNIREKLWFPDISLQDHDELTADDFLSPEIQFGIQFHLLVSKVDTEKNIDTEIDRAIKLGEISISNEIEIRQKLISLFQLEEYNELYEGAIQILSEKKILIDEKTTFIPDKLIIKENSVSILDFKTGVPKIEDDQQVLKYKYALEQMFYSNVTAHLVYTSTMEIKKVS